MDPKSNTRWFSRAVLVIALAATISAALFPPWLYTLHAAGMYAKRDAGLGFILDPPNRFASEVWGIQLDFPRLLLEWVCI